MPISDAVHRWYTAPDSDSRAAALEHLVQLGRDPSLEATDQRAAVSALIELVHLAGHPSDRVRRIAALGRAGEHAMSVPALHAETHSPHAEVRTEAFVALGRLGIPFGGTLVERWLASCSLDEEPSEVLEAAFLALARTGHPGVGRHAQRLWSTGRVSARGLHTALADAVSSFGLDLAREHVSAPQTALPAALHLAARRVDDLHEALEPMLRGGDLVHVQVAERLLELPHPSAADQLMDLLERSGGHAELGRQARKLRVHDPVLLVEAFSDLADGVAPDGGEARKMVRVALLAGIPELQPAALALAEAGGPTLLRTALLMLCHPSTGLEAQLVAWCASPEDGVAGAAVRALANVYGKRCLERVDHMSRSTRAVLRGESVRAYQNTLRHLRDASGRTTLPHKHRLMVEASLRGALQSDEQRQVEQGCFVAGNLGMTGLRVELLPKLTSEQPMSVRRAAATALSELPGSPEVDVLAERLLEEPVAPVRFRLVGALLRSLSAGNEPTDAVRAAAQAAALDEDPQVAVRGILLLGHAGSADTPEQLSAMALGEGHALACAAIVAMGQLRHPGCVAALTKLVEHRDPARRLRAAEALGRIGSEEGLEPVVGLAEKELEPEVRRAAVEALRHIRGTVEPRRLQPRGADDPLLFELLQLRMLSAAGQAPQDTTDLDERLAGLVPGLRPNRLNKRNPAALRSLRTALWLSELDELPDGLDAAPPVLFWTKGLELWLDDAAAPLRSHLLRATQREMLRNALGIWSGMDRHLPTTWQDAPGESTWGGLLKNFVDSRVGATASVRANAGALLAGGPLAERLGVPRWVHPMTDVERVALANLLARLAAFRNPLMHRRSGTEAEAEQVRGLAVQAAGLVVRLG